MYKVLNALSGKKTYLVAVVLALFNLAVAYGWIDPAHQEQINAVLVALGLGALRSGVAKAE